MANAGGGDPQDQVNGVFSQESGMGATGAVLQGNNGNFQTASARWLESLGSALLAETEALRDGVRLIPEGTGERIIVETDSPELVSPWTTEGSTGLRSLQTWTRLRR